MKGILFSLISIFSGLLQNPMASLIPGGENIGIEIKPNGVLVIGGYDVNTSNESYNPLKDSDIKKGDLIIKVNDEDVNSVKQMLSILRKHYNKDSIILTILRNNKEIVREIRFIKTSEANTIKTGLLVKERILGVGTVTFYDPTTKVYGALGHKLMDNDFSNITDINTGTIFESDVTSIHKSSNGNVGEIIANIYQDEVIGSVFSNTDYGIFGYYDVCPDKDALVIAKQGEVKLGEAYIYTTLKDNEVNKYLIEITSLEKQNKISTKGITFKIKDEKLIDKTGGIVQGMSGSPIIQDNKIIGAVTHVMVDSVKKGHGIYIEYMLEAAQIG